MLGSAVHVYAHAMQAALLVLCQYVDGQTFFSSEVHAVLRAAKQTAAAAIAVASIAFATFSPMVSVAPAAAAAAAIKDNAKVKLGCAVQARRGIIRKRLDDGVVDAARSVVKERIRALRPSTYSAARVHGTLNNSTRSHKRIINNKQTKQSKVDQKAIDTKDIKVGTNLSRLLHAHISC